MNPSCMSRNCKLERCPGKEEQERKKGQRRAGERETGGPLCNLGPAGGAGSVAQAAGGVLVCDLALEGQVGSLTLQERLITEAGGSRSPRHVGFIRHHYEGPHRRDLAPQLLPQQFAAQRHPKSASAVPQPMDSPTLTHPTYPYVSAHLRPAQNAWSSGPLVLISVGMLRVPVH